MKLMFALMFSVLGLIVSSLFVIIVVILLRELGGIIGATMGSYIFRKKGKIGVRRVSHILEFIRNFLFSTMIISLFYMLILLFYDRSLFWILLSLIALSALMLAVVEMRTKINYYKDFGNGVLPSIWKQFLIKARQYIQQVKHHGKKYKYQVKYFMEYLFDNIKSLFNTKMFGVVFGIILVNYVFFAFLVTYALKQFDNVGWYFGILFVIPFSLVFWINYGNNSKEEKNFRRIIMYIGVLLVAIIISLAKLVNLPNEFSKITEFIIFIFTVVFVMTDQIVGLISGHYQNYKETVKNPDK